MQVEVEIALNCLTWVAIAGELLELGKPQVQGRQQL